MKKTILEMAETVISAIMTVSSCMGLFLFGWFFGRLFFGEVTTEALWDIFLGSVILTLILKEILFMVKCELYKVVTAELQKAEVEDGEK